MITNERTSGTTADDLVALAEGIRASHRECVLAVRSSLGHALEAGALLVRAKRQVPKGEWERWVEGNCEFSKATAERYMRVAGNSARLLEEAPEAWEEMTMTGALRALSDATAGGGGGRAAGGGATETPRLAAGGAATPRAARGEFGPGSPQKEFIDTKAAAIIGEIRDLAGRAELGDGDGGPRDAARTAAAILEGLVRALKRALAADAGGPKRGGRGRLRRKGSPHSAAG